MDTVDTINDEIEDRTEMPLPDINGV